MPLDRAARVGDPIQHTQAEGWGLAGALAAVVVAVVIVAAAPIAVPLAIATITGAALVGKGLGETVGSTRPVSGAGIIVEGSPTVFTGPGMPNAARMNDPVDCHEAKKIADGSDSVFIEGWNASRRKDGTWCDGKIEDGCPTVEIGGNTIGQAGSEARTELSAQYRAFFKVVEVVNTISSLGSKEAVEEVVLWAAGTAVSTYGQTDNPGAREVALLGGASVDLIGLIRGKPASQMTRVDYFGNTTSVIGRGNEAYNYLGSERRRTYTRRD
jgi:uncharacterized Zn-binding protein involved in type VI secretion